MGGCASVPKEFLNRPESAPTEETPAKVEQQPESETTVAAPVEKTDGGDQKLDKEAPLVELSEPEKEAEVAADKPIAEVTSETKKFLREIGLPEPGGHTSRPVNDYLYDSLAIEMDAFIRH
ncbi:hypothetical protein JRO89_XS15G0001500 [Xanthoceras sorbifolium]|uniref:Uncharacterized protein n=1 Tax=Xanthoceras sorbifolium TaxID=99658 RepID=A0ABQ8H0F1_9ROSI|nr:hypothetical protein JRO89_XS15G0001500 [Xanthoceras sorbifolium]